MSGPGGILYLRYGVWLGRKIWFAPWWLARACARLRRGVGGLGWALLLVLLVSAPPISMPGTHGVDPMASWPVLVFFAAGALAIGAWLWEVSGPLALMWGWAVGTTIAAGAQVHSVIPCAYLLAGLVLYRRLVSAPAVVVDRWIRRGLIAALVVTAAIGTLNVAGIVPTVTVQQVVLPLWIINPRAAGKPHGMLTHPNDFALFVTLALPVLIAWIVASRRWRRGAACLLLLVLVGLLVKSETRAAAAGLVAAALALFAVRGARGVWVGAVAASGALLAAMVAFAPYLLSTLGGRTPAWTLGFDAAWTGYAWNWAGPWFGGGLGAWARWAAHPFMPIRAGAPWIPWIEQGAWWSWWIEAFNEYLQIQFELGLVGLVLAVMVLAQALGDAYALRASPAGLMWGAVIIIGAVAAGLHPILHRPALSVVLIVAAARLRSMRSATL